jgi:hypothetical protein
MLTKDGFVRVSTPKSLALTVIVLIISVVAFFLPYALPINPQYGKWVYLFLGFAGIVTLRASRNAMELRPEIADENLSARLRDNKMIMKNILRGLGVGYLVAIAFVIEGIAKYTDSFFKITGSLGISIRIIIFIYVVSTVIGYIYQNRYVMRK